MNENPKTCLITGATSGIGKAAAQALVKMSFRVIVLGRNEEKLRKTIAELNKITSGNGVFPCLCDLSSMKDVRSVAAKIIDSHAQIDVLINNAGARFLAHELTPEGIERTLATNHLGHYILTLTLIKALKVTGTSRIINVSSGTHYSAKGVIQNISSPETYDGRRQYANSKLANVLFTYMLSDKLKGAGIMVNAVDPGGVATNFARNNGLVPWLRHRFYYMRQRALLTPDEGADTVVYLAGSKEVDGVTGKYFSRRMEIRSADQAYDRTLQQQLRSLSFDLGGIDL